MPVALTIGIVGLPNVGKSTLFNALTKNNVLAANYPFATIEPNVGVVSLPDPRLAKLAEVFHSERILPATVSFVDIAGIVRGASEGEGLGNQFLANIREADAIAQVVRGFTDDDVVHVEGAVNPKNDLETINAELMLADLQTLEKAIPRLEKDVKGKRADAATLEAAVAAKDALERGILLSHSGLDLAPIRELGLMTAKPYIYVFNVDEAVLTDAARIAELEALVAPAHAVFLDAKIESELIDLDPEDAAELLASTGQEESGIDQLARIGFDTLGLQTYLTAGPEGGPRVDDRQGLEGPAGGRCDPHRLREGLHQGRGHLVRRPRRRRLGARGASPRQGPARGQGLRHAGRRRRRVPVQRLARQPLLRSDVALPERETPQRRRETADWKVSRRVCGVSGARGSARECEGVRAGRGRRAGASSLLVLLGLEGRLRPGVSCRHALRVGRDRGVLTDPVRLLGRDDVIRLRRLLGAAPFRVSGLGVVALGHGCPSHRVAVSETIRPASASDRGG